MPSTPAVRGESPIATARRAWPLVASKRVVFVGQVTMPNSSHTTLLYALPVATAGEGGDRTGVKFPWPVAGWLRLGQAAWDGRRGLLNFASEDMALFAALERFLAGLHARPQALVSFWGRAGEARKGGAPQNLLFSRGKRSLASTRCRMCVRNPLYGAGLVIPDLVQPQRQDSVMETSIITHEAQQQRELEKRANGKPVSPRASVARQVGLVAEEGRSVPQMTSHTLPARCACSLVVAGFYPSIWQWSGGRATAVERLFPAARCGMRQ